MFLNKENYKKKNYDWVFVLSVVGTEWHFLDNVLNN